MSWLYNRLKEGVSKYLWKKLTFSVPSYTLKSSTRWNHYFLGFDHVNNFVWLYNNSFSVNLHRACIIFLTVLSVFRTRGVWRFLDSYVICICCRSFHKCFIFLVFCAFWWLKFVNRFSTTYRTSGFVAELQFLIALK